FLHGSRGLRTLHPFPTRRSSDLPPGGAALGGRTEQQLGDLRRTLDAQGLPAPGRGGQPRARGWPVPDREGELRADRTARREPGVDRKSTRLNSSHLVISYAVFCL